MFSVYRRTLASGVLSVSSKRISILTFIGGVNREKHVCQKLKPVYISHHTVRSLVTKLIVASFLLWCCLAPLPKNSGRGLSVGQTQLSDLEVEVVTWTQIDSARPVSRYQVKATVLREGRLIEKSTVTNDHGKAFIPAVVWLGAELNITVKPMSEMLNPRSHYHRELLKNEGVDYADRSNESIKNLVPVEERRIMLTVNKISPDSPFEVRVGYTGVIVDVMDALGAPLPGAWVALVDTSTGLLVGWSYTNGSGHTSIMNVPVSGEERGEYFVEAYYLGEGLEGKPVWPFGAYGVWPCVYDSRLEEGSQKSIMVHGLHGRHINISTHVYEAELKFFYGWGIPIDVSVTVHPKHLRLENMPATHGSISIDRLPRGLYGVTAKWADVTVGSGNMNVTKSKGGRFVFNMNVDVHDLNLTVRDAIDSHTITDVKCEIRDPLGRVTYTDALNGRLLVQKLPKGYYTLVLNWVSPYTGERTEIARFMGNISYLASSTEIYTTTYDASFALTDVNGRPVSGATVTVGKTSKPTNPMGEAAFVLVPAGEYELLISKAGIVLERRTISIGFSFRTFSFVLHDLVDLTVKVIDREGQPINSAIVMLRRGDEIIASASTDGEGLTTLTQTVVDSYTVEASYGQTSRKILVTARELQISTPVLIELPLREETASTTHTTVVEGAVPAGVLAIVAVAVAASALVVLAALRRRKSESRS